MKFVFPEDCAITPQVFLEDDGGNRLELPGVYSIGFNPAVERYLGVGNLGDIVAEEIKPGTKTVQFAGGEITLSDPPRNCPYV